MTRTVRIVIQILRNVAASGVLLLAVRSAASTVARNELSDLTAIDRRPATGSSGRCLAV